MLLFDFSRPETAALFHPIGDRVMGGVSMGTMAPAPGCCVFSGSVSLENSGGFASVRSEEGSWDLSGSEGLALSARGDGKIYKLSVTTRPRYDSVVYRTLFEAPAEGWGTVHFPFGEFIPTFRGERVPGAPPLDPARISTFGFLISGRQEGPFRLMVRELRTY